MLLPTPSQDVLFGLMLNIAFWGKVMQVLMLIYDQTSIDIFFIDWERPRSSTESAQSSNQAPASTAVNPVRSVAHSAYECECANTSL